MLYIKILGKMGRTNKNSKKNCKTYTLESVALAMEEVSNGSTVYAAAKKYKIPRTSLFFKTTGKNQFGKKSGPPTVLSMEEEISLKDWIISMAANGFPVTKDQLLESVQLFLNQHKRKTKFKDNLPGRKWYKGFMTRHKNEISKRTSQNLTPARASVSEENLRAWHAEVQKYLTEESLLDVINDPKRIFNMDESAFYLSPKDNQVITKKGK